MPITTALSQFYGVKKTIIGAAQKPQEKPEEAFGKTIDGIPIMKIKPKPNYVRYAVKLPYENTERYVFVRPTFNSFILSVTTPVGVYPESGLPTTANAVMTCELKKSENDYASSGFKCGIAELDAKDKKILSDILDPLLKAEEEPEYKKMIGAALESLG